MKKLLNISVIAALAVLPMAANATAADVDKQPSAIDMTAQGAETTASNATATAAPKYELVASHTNDSNVATAGYVKGAYNATIRAINKVSETVATDLSGKANVDLSNVTSGSVTTDLINNGAVNADKLATDSVTTAKIADGNVTTAKLDAGAVTTAKIADSNVTADKLATDSVTTAKIVDGNVTTAKIADENVTLGKLSQSVQTSLGKADTALQQADLDDYATQDGVENTIETATITATVQTLTTWGNDSATGTVDVDVSSIEASYAEPVVTPEPEEP